MINQILKVAYFSCSAVELLEEQIAKKDEEIEHITKIVYDLHVPKTWSKPEGNV